MKKILNLNDNSFVAELRCIETAAIEFSCQIYYTFTGPPFSSIFFLIIINSGYPPIAVELLQQIRTDNNTQIYSEGAVCAWVSKLGTHLRTPNPGFNHGVSPPHLLCKRGVNPGLNLGFGVLRFGSELRQVFGSRVRKRQTCTATVCTCYHRSSFQFTDRHFKTVPSCKV
jgi:hypothetical protein